MSLNWYIIHVSHDEESGTAWFGPFDDNEIDDRLADPVADGFEQTGNIEAVCDAVLNLENTHVNPPEWWYEQLDSYDQSVRI